MVKLYFLVVWNLFCCFLVIVLWISVSDVFFEVVFFVIGVSLLLILVFIGNFVVMNKFDVLVLIIFCSSEFNILVFRNWLLIVY